MQSANKLLTIPAILLVMITAGVFVPSCLNKKNIEIISADILNSKNFHSNLQESAQESSINFSDTYFIADQKKKAIADQGIILKIGEKELAVPQEELYKWISIELIKKNCPEIISPPKKYCSAFDLLINESNIKKFLSGSAGVNYFSGHGKKLLIQENVFKIKKAITISKGKSALKIPLISLSESQENTELLGTGKTSFAGSSENRIANIEIGSSKLNNAEVLPGEEFSALKTIGKISAEEGYKPEANIRGGKTVMALGGGLCQVSTTLFRAALNAGLKITARSNHSYPIGYYSPQGTDAALAYPYTDLKFVNNTANKIYIGRKIENFQLIFEIYGKNDGRKVKINGPRILEKKEDGSFKTILHQEVYYAGVLSKKSLFSSFYRPKSDFPHE